MQIIVQLQQKRNHAWSTDKTVDFFWTGMNAGDCCIVPFLKGKKFTVHSHQQGHPQSWIFQKDMIVNIKRLGSHVLLNVFVPFVSITC